MSAVQTFDFNQTPVRVLDKAGQPWFVAADVCRVLEIANSRSAVEGLDEDEKGVGNSDTLGATLNKAVALALLALVYAAGVVAGLAMLTFISAVMPGCQKNQEPVWTRSTQSDYRSAR